MLILPSRSVKTWHELPRGYEQKDPLDIKARERARLFVRSGLLREKTAAEVREDDRRLNLLGIQALDAGVRQKLDPRLVGFGRTIQLDDFGMMGDFAVAKRHQGRGIGKAIIDQQLQQAEEAGIESLLIHGVSRSNTLIRYYFERGFDRVGEKSLGMGPNPHDFLTPLVREFERTQ